MKALVTGSAGFVGRHMVQALTERNYSIMLVDSANGGYDCRSYFAEYPDEHFELVVHCAAVVGGRTMIDGQPLLLACEDLSIDAALFRWALQARPGRIVYFSSSAVYPAKMQTRDGWCVQTGLRLDEATPQFSAGPPDQTYGLVKLTGERLAAEANAEGIPTHVFRPFSGYGPDQPLDYPFPTFIRRAIERQSPFPIWGDGNSARDWIHIDDIVAAVLAAIDQDVLGPVNLCTGQATTFDELAELCMTQAGHSAPIEYLADAPRGVHWRVGNPTNMHRFYQPRITIEQGINQAIAQTAHA